MFSPTIANPHGSLPTMSNQGTIVQIIGAVVDADFSKAEKLPEIYNALEIQYGLNGEDTKLVLEVQQHLGDGWVRAVAMSTTDGLQRGMTLVDTGKPIAVLVGSQVLGRIFNVTGELVDENAPLPNVDPLTSLFLSFLPSSFSFLFNALFNVFLFVSFPF